MTVPVVMRAAPVATAAEMMEPTIFREHEMYGPDALRLRPGLELPDIPVRIDHSKDAEPIGHVTAIRTETCWTGGTWVWLHAEITDPPPWLRKGSPVSIGRSSFDSRRPLGADWDLINRAFLNEVSLLTPGTAPAFPRAAVVWVGEPVTRAAAVPAGQVIYGGGVLRRPNVGRVLAVGGRPVRTSAHHPLRRAGADYIVDHPDGSSTIYSGPDGYQEALRDGVVLGVR